MALTVSPAELTGFMRDGYLIKRGVLDQALLRQATDVWYVFVITLSKIIRDLLIG
jgi:hypothetical protein